MFSLSPFVKGCTLYHPHDLFSIFNRETQNKGHITQALNHKRPKYLRHASQKKLMVSILDLKRA